MTNDIDMKKLEKRLKKHKLSIDLDKKRPGNYYLMRGEGENRTLVAFSSMPLWMVEENLDAYDRVANSRAWLK